MRDLLFNFPHSSERQSSDMYQELIIFFSFKLGAACQVGAVCSVDVDVGMDLTGFEQTV